MSAIAWAIVVAGIYMAHPRDKGDPDFYFNNWMDFLLFIFSLGMLLFFSFKT